MPRICLLYTSYHCFRVNNIHTAQYSSVPLSQGELDRAGRYPDMDSCQHQADEIYRDVYKRQYITCPTPLKLPGDITDATTP